MKEDLIRIFDDEHDSQKVLNRADARRIRLTIIIFHLLAILFFGAVIFAVRTLGTVYLWLEPLCYGLIFCWAIILVGFLLYYKWSWYLMLCGSILMNSLPVFGLYDIFLRGNYEPEELIILAILALLLTIPNILLFRKKLKMAYSHS